MRFLIALTILLAVAASAGAGALVPSKASQLADLGTDYTSCPIHSNVYAVNSINNPDTTISPFVIPPNQVFIVTAAEIGFEAMASGDRYQAALVRQTPAGGYGVIAVANGTSQGGASNVALTIPSGSVVKSGTLLCAVVVDLSGGGPIASTTVSVHGFFAKDS